MMENKMANVVGKVDDLQGKFYVKDPEGNLKELKNGDLVHEGETIVPDTTNVPTATVSIKPTDGAAPLKINSTQEQMLDKTLLNEGLNNEELAFNDESIQNALALNDPTKEENDTAEFAQLDGAQTDVNSDLRKKEFDSDKKEPTEEKNNEEQANNQFASLDGANTDVNSDLRQRQFGGDGSDYTQQEESGQTNQFAALNGDRTDVNSDLRQRQFGGDGSDYTRDGEDTQVAQFAALDGASTDVNSDLRQASWPGIIDVQQDNELSSTGIDGGSTFATRDGAVTDVVSDLRQAEWFGPVEEPTFDGDNGIDDAFLNNDSTKEANTIPIAVDDSRIVLKEGGNSVSGQLLTNDIPGKDGLVSGKELKEFTYNGTTHTFDNTHSTFTINGTTLGKLTVNQNGTWEIDQTGINITGHTEDSFTYKIIDSNGDISNSAKQPLIMFDADLDPNITTTTPEDTQKLILINDTSGDVIITDTTSSTSKTLGTNESINITRADTEVVGTVTNNGDGTVTFTPSKHYCGNDAVFGYEVTRSDNTNITNKSVTVTVTPTAETKTTDTNSDSHNDVITQGDKTYASINESATYNYISLTNLSVTNEDDRGNTANNPFSSELTTVKLSGVPIGFKFQYTDGNDDVQTLTVADVNNGVTIPFEYINTLQVKPTDYYAGEIKIEMRVITEDTETGKESTSTSAPDYLIINVNNVANGLQTLNAAQATGLEDAGRANGNTTNSSNPEAITAPANGIALDIDATPNDTSGREKVTTIIDEIPDGGAIYYSDANGTITVDKNGTVSGTNSNVTVIDNADNTFKVTIVDFKNDDPLKFVPPHNSNADYTFKVTAFTTDGQSVSNTTEPKTMSVTVTGVADIPVHDDFKKLDPSETTNADTSKNIYSDVVIEDNSNTRSGATISFKDLYKEAGLDSYDGDSETLSLVITNLGSNFSIQDATGISFNAKSGTEREWTFNVDKINDVVIQTSKNFSGDFTFKVKHITTEDDGNSKTFEKDVSILVKPLVEATVTTSASVTEDVASQVSFAIKHQNGDTNETLDALWINKADVTGKNFTLYTNSGATTALTAGGNITDDGTYYKLTGTAINSVYIKYDSNIGSANNPNNSFGIKYTVSDPLTVNTETLTSTNQETSAVYGISLLSITDTISVGTSNVVAVDPTDITYDSVAKTVTLNDLGSFTLDVDITGNSDTDGSEKATRLVIEGVQRGITVDGATMGISGSKNIWFLDVTDQDIDADGAKYTVTFNVNHRISPDTDSDIKITAYAKDSGSASTDITSASTTIKFIDNMIDVGGTTPVADIDAVMVVKNTLITEDTSFTLADVLTVTADTTHDTDNNAIYSIAFTSLTKVSFDMDKTTHTVNTYSDNGTTVYVVTATGTQTSIDSMLSNVWLKPDLNYNTNNDGTTNLTFNAVLTAYEASGYGRDTATVDFSSANNATSVKPVTDDITSNVTANNINEDGESTINITFDTVDKDANGDAAYKIVQSSDINNVVDATTVAITHKSGIYGTLTWSGGGTYTFSDTNKVANVLIGDIANSSLKFTPTKDASGSAKFSYTVYAKETDADNISETSKDFTITVSPVADGLLLDNLSGSGDEDTYIEIKTDTTSLNNATQIDNDSSESITSMFIDKVPEGFLLFIGDTHQTNATKGSKTGTVTIDSVTYDTYNWTIDISGGIPKIWIKAPENWSSTTNVELSLDTVVKDGSSTTTVSKTFNVTVGSVVDGFSSLSADSSIQTISDDVAINLNANAIDLDGSETGILTLSGFGANDVTFKQDGTTIASTYDNTGGIDTYTISNINLATDKLNTLTFQKAGLQGETINYTFKTVENGGATSNPAESGTFTATTDNIINNITTAGTAGTDRLVLSAGDIDFTNITSTSIEKIDLIQNGNINITNVKLSDVVDMTDGNNDLIIISDDNNDTVALDNSEGTWSKSSTTSSYGGKDFFTYTNNGNASVSLKISDEVAVTIA
jgi:hypothetical protein